MNSSEFELLEHRLDDIIVKLLGPAMLDVVDVHGEDAMELTVLDVVGEGEGEVSHTSASSSARVGPGDWLQEQALQTLHSQAQ